MYAFIYSANINYYQQSNTESISSRAAVKSATSNITAAAS